MGSAFAHDLHSHTTPHTLFVFKWIWDPTLLLFLFMALLYINGLYSFKKNAPVALWQKILFFTGIAVLTLAYLPPVDPLADQLFSAHMAQHMLITLVGIPLVVFGSPFIIALKGLPALPKRIYLAIMYHRKVKSLMRTIHHPLAAVLIYEGVFWFWHIPKFYNLALLNDLIHMLEHACMALAALNFWPVIIDSHPMHSRVKLPVRIFILGLIMTTDMALSAALTYSERVWYAYENLPAPSWWAWDRLQDQRLGGLIMWVPGGVIWTLAMIGIFIVWSRQQQE